MTGIDSSKQMVDMKGVLDVSNIICDSSYS